MTKFEIFTNYVGGNRYIVEAENQEEAEEKFSEGTFESVEDWEVCDSHEEVEKIKQL